MPDPAAAQRLVDQAVEQGFDRAVDDPVVLSRIATILAPERSNAPGNPEGATTSAVTNATPTRTPTSEVSDGSV